jgi:hypothetical protein
MTNAPARPTVRDRHVMGTPDVDSLRRLRRRRIRSIEPANDAGGRARTHRSCRQLAPHDGIRTDHGACADSCPTEHCGLRADPDVGADDDGVHGYLAGRGRRSDAMVVVTHGDKLRKIRAFTDFDRRAGGKSAVVTYERTSPELNATVPIDRDRGPVVHMAAGAERETCITVEEQPAAGADANRCSYGDARVKKAPVMGAEPSRVATRAPLYSVQTHVASTTAEGMTP